MKIRTMRLAACAASAVLALGCSAAGLRTVTPSESLAATAGPLSTFTTAPSIAASATSSPLPPTASATGTAAPPAQATDTEEPTVSRPTLSPAHTENPAPAPEIVYFRASVDLADPGDMIQISWSTRHATQVTLYHLMPSGQYGNFWEVDPAGSMDFVIPPTARNQQWFQLWVLGSASRKVDEMLTISLACPDEWYFEGGPDECPSGPPIRSDGAEQHFQHGTMLWDVDEQVVYILYEDNGYPKWQVIADNWDEGEQVSDPDIVPPDGLFQPIRGFGLVWRVDPSVRDRLGWAVDQEASYRTAIQRTSRYKYNVTFVSALDGGVWELGPENSEWHYIPQ